MRRVFLSLVFAVVLALAASSASAAIPAGYYNGTDGLNDQALTAKLRQIISSGQVSHSYSAAKDTIYSTIDLRTDGMIRSVYTGRLYSSSSSLNIEHTWPQSRGADSTPAESDVHHLYPVEPDLNSRRGNLPFGDVTTPDYSDGGSEVDNGVMFEPRDDHKGDCARAIFYFAVRYNLPLVNTGTTLGTSEDKMGFEDALRSWHTQDPVSADEIARHERVYTYQKNRNPFIDHPEFVDRIATFGAVQPTATVSPTPSVSPTASQIATVTPTAGPTQTPGAETLDLSGWSLHQANSTQSFTLPAGTQIRARSFLIVTRESARATFESDWSVTLAPEVGLVGSGGTCPQINGQETYELRNASGTVVSAQTDTATLSATGGSIAVRQATNTNSWSAVATGATPGQGAYATNDVGVVITKFGEPASGFASEFVELYWDVAPTATATPTPTPTPSPTVVPSPTAAPASLDGWLVR